MLDEYRENRKRLNTFNRKVLYQLADVCELYNLCGIHLNHRVTSDTEEHRGIFY